MDILELVNVAMLVAMWLTVRWTCKHIVSAWRIIFPQRKKSLRKGTLPFVRIRHALVQVYRCGTAGLLVTVFLMSLLSQVAYAQPAPTPPPDDTPVVVGPDATIIDPGRSPYAPVIDCRNPPEPDRPGSGLVGSLDTPGGKGTQGSVYWEVGYAGLTWHDYDQGCVAAAAPILAQWSATTWLANGVFNVAKLLVGFVNWAHYLIADGSEVFAPLDNLIETATRTAYEAVYLQYIGPVLVVLAVLLLILAMRGNLPEQYNRAGYAVIALAIAGLVYQSPVNTASIADDLLLDGVTQMQNGFLTETGMGDEHTLPTVLVDQVIYQNWLMGLVGNTDVPQTALGRDVLRAQTFTIQEVEQGLANDALAEQKKQDFKTLGEQMGDRYDVFKGERSARMGAAVLAWVQAACIAAFQLVSKLLILVCLLILRMLVMTGPFWALLIILRPQTAHDVLRIAGAAIINTIIVGFLAGVHAVIVISVFREDSGIDLWLALLITGGVTYFFWSLGKPFKRLSMMLSLTTQSFSPSQPSGRIANLWRRYTGASNERQTRWWNERKAAHGQGYSDPSRDRPESTQPTQRRSTPIEPQPSRKAIEAGAVDGSKRPRPAKATEADIVDGPIYERKPPTVVADQGKDGVYDITSDSSFRIYKPRRRT